MPKSAKHYRKLLNSVKEYIKHNSKLRRIPWNKKNFTTGEKAAITKAANTLASFTNSGFVPIKKKKGESNYAYNKRIVLAKENLGQHLTEDGHNQYTGIGGVFVDYNTNRIKTSFDDNMQITAIVPHADHYLRERIIPIDKYLFLRSPGRHLKRILNNMPDDAQIQLWHTKQRGLRSYTKDEYKQLLKYIHYLRNKYGENEYLLTGFVIIEEVHPELDMKY